ncbi:MAG: cytochrome c biogenesis protein CcsA [Betaproteobacteria bacterium]|nr:cytochrome c biogenesis protein CcsA [Betaproteobacteria bacterium]
MLIVNQLSLFSFLLAFAGALYFALGVRFWKSRWSESGALPLSVRVIRVEKFLVGMTMVIHATGLQGLLFGQGGMQFSFALAFCLMAWLAVLIYWLESFQVRLDGIQPIVLLSAALAAFLPLIFPNTHTVAHIGALSFRFHLLVTMLACGFFALAVAHAIFMGLLERRLHSPSRVSSRRIGNMPPLLALEALLFRILNIAFVLLTLALGSGFLYSEEIFGRALTFDHKTVFGVLSWLIFAILLIGRHIYGWRGRRALNWTIAGFCALLLAYIGKQFVLEVLLGRA